MIMEDYPLHYYFIGRLLGKALYENLLIELPLASFFLYKMTGIGMCVCMYVCMYVCIHTYALQRHNITAQFYCKEKH